jgi:hypothetical protein
VQHHPCGPQHHVHRRPPGCGFFRDVQSMPFFAYILLGIFLLAAWIFEQKSEDDD